MLPFQKRLSNFFYAILSLPATAMGFGLSVQIAALSWILRTQYGLDIHEIGIVWAAGPIAGILGQPIIGLISDKVWFWGGRRRPFILVGGLLAGLAIFALPHIGAIDTFLGIGSIMAVAITIALTLDLAINISFNPTRSIIADVTPDGPPRTKGYTWMQSISNLFGSMAYLVGALFGNFILIYVGVAVILLFSIIPVFFIEEPRHLEEEAKEGDEPVKETKTQWGELWKIYIAHGFSWLGIQTMFIYAIIFIEKKINPYSPGVDVAATDLVTGQIIGWSFFLLNAVGAIWPIFVLEPIARKIGRVKTHVLAVALMALGYFAIVFFARNQISLYVLMAILSFGWAAVVSLPFAIMSEKVNRARMGFFMGIFNLSVVLPQLVASFVMGFVIKALADPRTVFIISGISLSISAFLWIFVSEGKKKSVPEVEIQPQGIKH
ncbi:MAG: MFS transporter [Bacteroides sp.]|jgi:MFS family permease|nr:MFS transporter [Bacteroides sp.]